MVIDRANERRNGSERTETLMPAVWAGIDSGKWTHHCAVIDQSGTALLSKRVENDETMLEDLIKTVVGIADGDNMNRM